MSDFNSLITYFIAFMQCPPVVNSLPTKLGSNILNGEFNNNILNTLVSNLVPDLSKLKLLNREVQH